MGEQLKEVSKREKGVSERVEKLTKSVIASVYNTSMKRNLKKLAACGARPAIQYVLSALSISNFPLGSPHYRNNLSWNGTHIVETRIVGIIRSGMTSKTKREKSHAVGLAA